METLKENDFLKLQRISLMPLGCWPIGRFVNNKCYKLLTVINFLCITACIIPEIHFLISHIDDIPLATEVLCPMFTVILSIIKFIVIMSKWNKMSLLIGKLQHLWMNNKDPSATVIFLQAELITRRCTYPFLILATMAGGSYVTIPIAKGLYEKISYGNTTWELPIKTQYIYDVQLSPAYELTFTWFTYAVYIAVFAAVGVDSLFLGLSLHLCVHFKILQRDLTNLYIEIEEKNSLKKFFDVQTMSFKSKIDPYIALHDRLKIGIKRHIDLIELVNEFENVYGPILSAMLLVSSFIICVTGLHTILAMNNNVSRYNVVIYINYLGTVVLQLFFYSWSGSQIIEESRKISQAAYFCEWWCCPAKFKQALQMMILRGQRPCEIKTLFYIASLPTFTALLSTAASYLTLLQTLMEEK